MSKHVKVEETPQLIPSIKKNIENIANCHTQQVTTLTLQSCGSTEQIYAAERKLHGAFSKEMSQSVTVSTKYPLHKHTLSSVAVFTAEINSEHHQARSSS